VVKLQHPLRASRPKARPCFGAQCWGGLAALILTCFSPGSWADEFDTLRSYWASQLVGTNLSSSTLNSRANTANGYWSSMNTNAGRTNLWSTLPLGSSSANLTSTFSRLEQMALAWATPGCSVQGHSDLAAAIAEGMDWMCANVYTPTTAEYANWWDWEIGAPQQFNNALVLLYPALSGLQITNYINSVDHFSPPVRTWMTGANLADKCKVVLIRGIVGRNASKLSSGQTNLSPVFPYVTTGDGFYTDGSFRQHTTLAYTGTYGNVLLNDIAQLVNLLNGSTWEVTDPNLANVYAWVTNSFAPLIYHGAMMDMVRGRAVSRSGETEINDGNSTITAARQIALFAPPEVAAALTNWANSPWLPPAQYQFPCMDRVVALRPGFGFGLSLSSTRIANYESINGENLHGWFTGDGMTYLYLGTNETQFIGAFWPTVDPYHLPGTTVQTKSRTDAVGEARTTSQNWVGGAQVADTYGLAGMSLAAYGTTLTAKKSWFMFDNEVVCLGAGITCGDSYGVDTTVEDRRLGSAPTNSFTLNGVVYPPTIGWSTNPASASWCALDGVGGYFFPGGATNLQAMIVSNTGSWFQINTNYATNLLSDNYLKLWFGHGLRPTNATYAYVLLPGMSRTAVSNYAAGPGILVLTNTTTVQAASKPALGIVAANFWADGTNSADLITVNKKASVITLETASGLSVGVADPTQTNTSNLTVTLNRPATTLVSADPGVTVVQLTPQIILSVNLSGSLGKTFQAVFSYAGANLAWDANTNTAGAQDGSGSWESANWWNGATDTTWSDTVPSIAQFGAGGTAGTVTLASPHQADTLIFNPVNSGAYTLSGAGSLTVTNGITAGASATLNVPLVLPATQIWTVAAGQTLAASQAVSAPVPMTLALAGAGNIKLAGPVDQLSPRITALDFVDTANDTTLEVSPNPQTVGALGLNDGVTGTVTGSGSLQVIGAADFRVGGETADATQVLDMSGLSSFIYSAPTNTFAVGSQVNGVTGTGTVYLAASSRITAANVGVQNVTGGTSTPSRGTLNLGGNTVIYANNLSVGLVRDNGTLQFQAGLTNPVLVLRAADGSGRAQVTVGSRSSSYFATATGLIDLVTNVIGTSTLDAQLGTLQLANESYCLTPSRVLNGMFAMGGGTLDATAIVIGSKTSSASQSLGIVNGTFTQTGGTVRVGTLTLGDRVTGNTNTLNATYNLNGGALNPQLITPGANTATRSLNWSDGSIGTYDANTDLTIAPGVSLTLSAAGLPAFAIGTGRTGTVNAIIGGAGSLTKNGGAGTLVLAAANTYTGATTVSSGTLLVTGSLPAASAVTVGPAGRLGGTGVIAGAVTVNGTLAPGTLGLGTLAVSNHLTLAGTVWMELAKNGSTLSCDQVTGVRTVTYGGLLVVTNLGTAALAAGDSFKLFSATNYSGAFTSLVLPPGAVWDTTQLAVNGTLRVGSNVPPTIATATWLGARGFELSFTGTPGSSYRVWGMTNPAVPLTNWLLLESNRFDAAGAATYADTAATNFPQRCYSISTP
jgi:hyaluronate lyase